MSSEPEASYVETLEYLRDAHLLEIEALQAKLAEYESRECQECGRLRETNTRLSDEIAGLYERIASGDKRLQKQYDEKSAECDDWFQKLMDLYDSLNVDLDEQDTDALERYRDWDLDNKATLERLRLLEAEAMMLRRKVGTGRQRGRLPEWTPYQAGQVVELRTTGKSLRETAREAGLSLGQVRTILARPPERPHPATAADERLANRTRELDKLIRGAQAAQVKSERRATALAKAAAGKPKRRSKSP